MASGAISTLGIGSGMDLQGILDSLRAADETLITKKTSKKNALIETREEFNAVNAKMLALKSHSLSLSLGSNYLKRNTSITDDSIINASAVDGTEISSHSISVSKLAVKHSFQSSGFASKTGSVNPPTIQKSTNGFGLTDQLLAAGETITISYGSGDTIKSITLTAGKEYVKGDIVNVKNRFDTLSKEEDKIGLTVDGEKFIKTVLLSSNDNKKYLQFYVNTDKVQEKGEDRRLTVTTTSSVTSFSMPGETTETFSYSLSNSDPVEISVPLNTSLSDLVDLINNDENNPGVTASIIDTGFGETPFCLVLTANETGEDNRITINKPLEDIVMKDLNGNSIGDLNAKIISNGITYERETNTINDIINGVTLSLKKTGDSSFSISKETSSIKDDIIGLITSMNEIITEIDANDDYDEETDTWGSLAKTSSIKVAKNSIITIMGTQINNIQGSISNFYDLGFEINRDGTVKIDEKILDEKITSNFDSISEFFSGNIDNNIIGMAEILKDKINEITNSSGIINNEKNSAQTKIDRINEQIDKETEKLNKRYEIMTKQFVQLDSFMKKMESQTNYVTQMFNSMQSSSKDS